jgi:hypothetical protein
MRSKTRVWGQARFLSCVILFVVSLTSIVIFNENRGIPPRDEDGEGFDAIGGLKASASLTGGGVSPGIGYNSSTKFNLTVTYTDAGNIAPDHINVTVAGATRAMLKVNAGDADYTDGCLYSAVTTISTIGFHEYRFNYSHGVEAGSAGLGFYPHEQSNADFSGNNRNGATYEGSLTPGTYRTGGALGNAQELFGTTRINTPIMPGMNSYSFSAFFKADSFIDNNYIDGVVVGSHHTTRYGSGMGVNSTAISIVYNNGYVHHDYAFSTGTWYHLAVTIDRSSGEIISYVNGAQVDRSIVIFGTQTIITTFQIGYDWATSQGFDGLIDEVYIFQGVLASEDVAYLYSRATNLHAPSLFSPTVMPISGNPATSFNFSVRYVDEDENAPVFMNVSINGTSHVMEKVNPADTVYSDGCDYQLVTYLQPGSYNYSFSCRDGEYSNSTPVFLGLTVSPSNLQAPVLSGGGATPVAGFTGTTPFRFRVNFSDADNNIPAFVSVMVAIDGDDTTYPMVLEDSGDVNFMDGAWYTVTTTIPVPGHASFHFNASDGSRPASDGPYAYPVVYDDSPVQVAGQLIGYYALDGNALDSSPAGNHGTPTTITYGEGYVGQAAVFNGYSSKIALPMFAGNNPYTYCAMFNAREFETNARGNAPIVFGGYTSECLSMGVNASGIKIMYKGGSVFHSRPFSLGTWYHVAVAFDRQNGTVRSFVNGVQSGLSTGLVYTTPGVSTQFYIGYQEYSAERYYFNGSINDVRIYQRILSAWEVAATCFYNEAPPVLFSPVVVPSTGNQCNRYNFSVVYSDADNNLPALIRVSINSTAYQMVKSNPADHQYTDGCTFYYATYLQPGSYVYEMLAEDYFYPVSTGAFTNLTVLRTNTQPPVLSNATSGPYRGVAGSGYSFSIRYSDADNNAPASINVTIGGINYPLTKRDPSDVYYVDGSWYDLLIVLNDIGNFSHTYTCDDGGFVVFDGPYPGPFIHPLVNYVMIPGVPFYDQDTSGAYLFTLGNETNVQIILPFKFTFYNAVVNRMWVCSNGYISFFNYIEDDNVPFPSAGFPLMIAPSWDDYNDVWVRVKNATNPSRVIVDFMNMDHEVNGTLAANGIQVILYEHGDILFNYDYLANIHPSNTCGLNYGINTSFYNTYPLRRTNDAYSILFKHPRNYCAPDLTQFLVTPGTGNQTTRFGIRATYTDLDNDQPSYVTLVVNGTSYPMSKAASSDIMYFDGCIYTATLPFLSPGTYLYHVEASDGTNVVASPDMSFVVSDVNLQAPLLTSGNVNKWFGYNDSTWFVFQVLYTDADNNVPTSIRVNVNGTGIPMQKANPLDDNFMDGCWFQAGSFLPAGTCEFSFDCDDGTFTNSTGTFPEIDVATMHVDVDFEAIPVGTAISTRPGWYVRNIGICSETVQLRPDGSHKWLAIGDGGSARAMAYWMLPIMTPTSGTLYFTVDLSSTAVETVFAVCDGLYDPSFAIQPTGMILFRVYQNSLWYHNGTAYVSTMAVAPGNAGALDVLVHYDLDRGWHMVVGSTKVTANGSDYSIKFVGSPLSLDRFEVFTQNSGAAYQVNIDSIGVSWLPNVAPSLSFDPVTPASGNQFTTWNFTVLYTDANNNPASQVNLVINGTVYPMSQVDPADNHYTDGARFSVEVRTWIPGNYTYYASCSDGTATIQTSPTVLVVDKLNDNDPVLSSPTVLPLAGDLDITRFTFSVVYTDADNNTPAFVNVEIDGVPHAMTRVDAGDTNYVDGCTFTYSTMLSGGPHGHSFNCSDGERASSIGMYSAPFVATSIPDEPFEAWTAGSPIGGLGSWLAGNDPGCTTTVADLGASSKWLVLNDMSGSGSCQAYWFLPAPSPQVGWTRFSISVNSLSTVYAGLSDGMGNRGLTNATGQAMINTASGSWRVAYTATSFGTVVAGSTYDVILVYNMSAGFHAIINGTFYGYPFGFPFAGAPVSFDNFYAFTYTTHQSFQARFDDLGVSWNAPPSLSAASISTMSALEIEPVTFNVTYTDPDNHVPGMIRVEIGGVLYGMAKAVPADVNYTDGCVYTATLLLPPGTYSFRFTCTDGWGTDATVATPGLVIQDVIVPTCTQPGDFAVLQYGPAAQFSWALTTSYSPGQYRILVGGIPLVNWTTWPGNATPIPVNLNVSLAAGEYNYTIEYNDSISSGVPGTVLVTIDDVPVASGGSALDGQTILDVNLPTSIPWIINDLVNGTGLFRVLVNGTERVPWSPWTSGVPVGAGVVMAFGYGKWNYTLQYVDAFGIQGAQDSITVRVSSVPSCSQVAPTWVLQNQTRLGEWTIHDHATGSGMRRIFLDGVVLVDWAPWTNGTSVSTVLDGNAGFGFHNYTLQFQNANGISGIDNTIIMLVEDAPAAVELSPSPSIVEYQSFNSYIYWVITDRTGGGVYNLTRNGTTIRTNYAWTSGVNIGVYVQAGSLAWWNYTLNYRDNSGVPGNQSDITVIINDTPRVTSSANPSGFSVNADDVHIHVTITDEQDSGWFTVLSNGVPLPGYINVTWTSGVEFSILVDTSVSPGTMNYTIVYWDSIGVHGDDRSFIMTARDPAGGVGIFIDFVTSNWMYLAAGGGLLVATIIAAVSAKKRKKKQKSKTKAGTAP